MSTYYRTLASGSTALVRKGTGKVIYIVRRKEWTQADRAAANCIPDLCPTCGRPLEDVGEDILPCGWAGQHSGYDQEDY